MAGRTVYSVESHDQVLGIWRKLGYQGVNILHLDFHCDLRGLLIDRKKQLAFRIWDRHPQLNEGNFLTHAVCEGIVRGIRWVHDIPGGRRDDLMTVKYATDATALIHRASLAIGRKTGIPVNYEVIEYDNWQGLNPGEILDIDWDVFACDRSPANRIHERVQAFLDRDLRHLPDQVFICQSPEYCHPSESEYHQFVEAFAKRINADVVQVPFDRQPRSQSSLKAILKPVYEPARDVYHFGCQTLRRYGIY